MSRPLTDRQLLHRQYLQSPVWKAKREEALAHYGCLCNRCGKHGADVHHKTYDRVGGAELMDDLEVLCRFCHEAHHTAERAIRTKGQKSRSVNRRAIFRYLTKAQRAKLVKEFGLSGEGVLSYQLVHGDNTHLVITAARLLGFTHFHSGVVRKKRRDRGWHNDPSHPQYRRPTPPPQERWMSLEEFRASPNPFSASSSSS